MRPGKEFVEDFIGSLINNAFKVFANRVSLKYNASERILSMSRFIFTILLIWAILTCPLRCLVGICPSSDACGDTVKSCCTHCATRLPQQRDQGDDDSSAPANTPLEPIHSGGCLCICHGALIEAMGSSLSEQSENMRLQYFPVPDPVVALGSSLEYPVGSIDLFVGIKTGQSLCILHRVLLL